MEVPVGTVVVEELVGMDFRTHLTLVDLELQEFERTAVDADPYTENGFHQQFV